MAHPQQLCFVETASKHLAPDGYAEKRLLEIGSYDVNGTIRPFFSGASKYVGVDLIAGPSVDSVIEGHKLADPDEAYDLTIACECFEHNPRWIETLLNMYRLTRRGGILIFTCATTGRLEHGTARTASTGASPGTQGVGWGYYRNLRESDFREQLCFESKFESHLFLINRQSRDLYFIGQRAGAIPIFRFSPTLLRQECIEAQKEIARQATRRTFHARSLIRATVVSLLAALLPDRHYQDLALLYRKIKGVLKTKLRA
jgi:hypothetical protein